jgi:hypothetical protein
VTFHLVAGRGRALDSDGNRFSRNSVMGTSAIHVRKSILGLIDAGVELLIKTEMREEETVMCVGSACHNQFEIGAEGITNDPVRHTY